MADWCENQLTIQAKSEDAYNAIKEAIQGEKLCEFALPKPKGAPKEWEEENWGTREDIFHLRDVRRVTGSTLPLLVCTFDTAWLPPLKVYERLVEMGYQVSCDYHCIGTGLCDQFCSSEA